MHILIVHQAFAALDEPGGTRHHELARFLVGRGHRVTVIASPVSYLTGATRTSRPSWVTRQEGASLGEGITVLRAYTYPALHRSFVHRVFSFLSFMISSFLTGLGVRDVDLVWGTSPPIFQGATAWALAKLKRAPFLFEVRDLWPAFAIAVGVLHQPFLIRASEWFEGFLYRRADQVMVNSPGFREHVMARGAARVALIPNGADMAMFDPEEDGTAFRQEHGLMDHFVALYAGAHGMSNDLEILLRAADRLRDRRDLVIVLLGDGKEKDTLQAQARELALSNVRFLPPVPKTAMPQALAAADVCIAILKPIPLYATVYPNKVFDYMAAGRAVVLAIDGVIREVVEAADGGVYVPPGDPQAMAEALASLADDRARGHALGLNGRRYLESHFDRAALAEELGLLVELMYADTDPNL